MFRFLLLAIVLVAALAACSNDGEPTGPDEAMFPDVVSAIATQTGPGLWDFSVTVSSPYDSDERYADAWRIVAPDGTVLGERELTHPHADEQPFTRRLAGVRIPPQIRSVTVSARDSRNGYEDGAGLEVGITPVRE